MKVQTAHRVDAHHQNAQLPPVRGAVLVFTQQPVQSELLAAARLDVELAGHEREVVVVDRAVFTLTLHSHKLVVYVGHVLEGMTILTVPAIEFFCVLLIYAPNGY